MAPSFDCTVSSLLCAEDNIFDDNDFGSVRLEEFEEAMWPLRNRRNYDQNRGFDDEGGLPLQSDEYLASMVEKECHHLPGSDYLMRLQSGDLDLGARKQAVDWIGKVGSLVSVCSSFCFLFFGFFSFDGKFYEMGIILQSERAFLFNRFWVQRNKGAGFLQVNLKFHVFLG